MKKLSWWESQLASVPRNGVTKRSAWRIYVPRPQNLFTSTIITTNLKQTRRDKMGEPSAYLPPPLSDASIYALLQSLSLPRPTSIVRPKVTAEYHSIYVLNFNQGVLPAPADESLILRVAGCHLPTIKTENESAVLTWIARNCSSIPVPAVIAHDSTSNNPLGYEYELMVKASGVTVSDIYDDLSVDEKQGIISQLADVLAELHKHQWDHVGGLEFNDQGDIAPGPVVEETFWQQPEMEKFWAEYPAVTMDSLNITGPYNGYVEYIAAHIERYIFAIETHSSLEFMRDIVPRLKRFIGSINKHKSELNNVKYRLSHFDMHLGNILYDREGRKITTILDWEFAGVVPCTRRDRAFLWNGQSNEESSRSLEADMKVFEKVAEEKGYQFLLEDAKYTSELQEHMQLAQNYLRAICEVSPRGQKEELRPVWKETVLEHIAAFETES